MGDVRAAGPVTAIAPASRDTLVYLVSMAAKTAVEDTGEAAHWQELAELMLETIDRWLGLTELDDPIGPAPSSP
jgi:hypothetical protein